MNMSNSISLFLNVLFLKQLFLIFFAALNANKKPLSAITCESVEYIVIIFQKISIFFLKIDNYKVILNN